MTAPGKLCLPDAPIYSLMFTVKNIKGSDILMRVPFVRKNPKSILTEARMTDCNSLRISLKFLQNVKKF